MDASRLRLGSAAEWTVAIVFLVGTVGVGGLIVREFISIRGSSSPPIRPQTPAVKPASLPSLSIPVSALPLPDGKELRLGDSISRVEQVLGRQVATEKDVVEQGTIGRRISRAYEYANIRFTLIFEPFERDGELRIVGIYVR